MPSDPQEYLRAIVAISVFVLVLALWIMAVAAWTARHSAKQEKIQRRLEMIAQPNVGEGRILRLWTEGREVTTIVPGAGHAHIFGRLEQMRRLADIQAPVGVILLAIGGAALAAAVLVVLLVHSALVGACTALAVMMVAWITIQQRIAKRAVIFETQLVDALELAARSLRAGHPLPGAFRLIAEEIGAPVGTVFGEVCQQQDLGVGVDASLRKAADDSPSPDLKLFATSVIIQIRSGGNLADMMERLSQVIRERMRLSRRVRVLTAQTQFSKWILLLMPFAVFVILNVINPEYMRPLYSTGEGNVYLAWALGLLLAGAWIMNRLAIIRY
jgi:tight adherence protein B